MQVSLHSQSITQITSFGSNPGGLNMYDYVPSGLTGKVPLVVALHGCTENAASFSEQSGWNKLALLHGFYMVYPEQPAANNSEYCFNWFDTTQIERNKGEALSIFQMVNYMKAHYNIDTTRIYVTGISAGGAMTAVMMAVYPDVFKSGAVMSGVPYWAATNATTALYVMDGFVVNTYTPAQWAELVRKQFPGYNGAYPHLAVFQGTADEVVDTDNTTQLIDQWTELNHAHQCIDSTFNSFQGNSDIQRTIFNDSSANPVVYHYKIIGMPHAIAVDTGSCPRQGGETGTYAVEETHFHSTYYAADFFDLIPNPYSITGAISVAASASGITYSVTNTSGSSYIWTVPQGATIVSGQGTNSITVDFGTKSGDVTVTETTKAGCENDEASLFVNVGVTTVVPVTGPLTNGRMYYVNTENSIHTENIPLAVLKTLHIYNLLGQDCTPYYSIQGTTLFLQEKLPNSIYIINLQDESGRYSGKIAVY
ncbi:MAG: PHB depolymerase family esterase [Bacteroidia bacterium]